MLIYKATELVNFAQGDLLMLGAFVAYMSVVLWGLDYWVGFLIAALVVAAFGALLDTHRAGAQFRGKEVPPQRCRFLRGVVRLKSHGHLLFLVSKVDSEPQGPRTGVRARGGRSGPARRAVSEKSTHTGVTSTTGVTASGGEEPSTIPDQAMAAPTAVNTNGSGQVRLLQRRRNQRPREQRGGDEDSGRQLHDGSVPLSLRASAPASVPAALPSGPSFPSGHAGTGHAQF